MVLGRPDGAIAAALEVVKNAQMLLLRAKLEGLMHCGAAGRRLHLRRSEDATAAAFDDATYAHRC